MVKLQKNHGSFIVTLPTELVRAMSWKRGDVLEFKVRGAGKLELSRSETDG